MTDNTEIDRLLDEPLCEDNVEIGTMPDKTAGPKRTSLLTWKEIG